MDVPIERRLGTLKNVLRNRSRLEGSITEAYLENEMLAFWERYTDDVQTRYNRDISLSHDGPSYGDIFVFMNGLKLIGKTRVEHIDDKVRDKLVWYALNNCDEVQPFVE
jgi:hypothetical protein